MRHRDDPDSAGQGAPLVGRPRGPAWRALQADGILWEGQVLLIGVDVDLAARLIVTEHRLAFARGGAVVLDVPRAWLQPAPALRRDDTVLLSITADGNPEPERILLRMRDGHPATNHLLDLLVGPGRAAPVLPSEAGPEPSRGTRVLPPLPEPARPEPSFPRPRPTGDPALTRPLPTSPREPFGAPPPAAAAAEPPPSSTPLLEPVVRPAPPPAAIGRDRDWNLQPLKGMVPHAARRRRGWTFRLGGLVLLLALAAFVGSRPTPSVFHRGTEERFPAATGRSGPTTVAQAILPTPTARPTAVATQQVALAIGVGGQAATATATTTAAPTATSAAPTSAPQPAAPEPTATSGAASVGQEAPIATSTQAPTATAVPPTATVASEPTAVPEPTSVPATATAAPTATTVPPTAVVPAAIPTATSVSTTEPAAAPTAAATAASTAVPTEESGQELSQEPSVAVDGVPDQALVAGPLRYTVEVAERGPTLPDFGLPSRGAGDWVALIVHARNTSDRRAELPMETFRLQANPSGELAALDSGTGVIAGVVGLDPAFGNADVVRFQPGQEHRLALVFLVPPDTESVTLLVGQVALDLGPALERPRRVDDLDLGATPPVPELVEATVTRVLDGERIEVELAGTRSRVRYLGIDAPVGDRCYAQEATRANAALVEGQTVWLERERTDADLLGNLVRDVWIAGPEGGRVLVAVLLAEQGAAEPNPEEPDVRYAGWIAAAAEAARADAAGLWGACAAEAAADPSAPVAAASRPFSARQWLRLGWAPETSTAAARPPATHSPVAHVKARPGRPGPLL